jgi:hypothetical protein
MVVSERYLKNGEQFMVRVYEEFVHGVRLFFVRVYVRALVLALYLEPNMCSSLCFGLRLFGLFVHSFLDSIRNSDNALRKDKWVRSSFVQNLPQVLWRQ